MSDFPVQGGSEGSWGTEYYDFIKLTHTMDGAHGGELAIVCNENQVVCNENQVVVNIELDV